ncbi:MAG: hypothetical protein COA65_06345 [Rhodospirillaceae bacterium]|nr:MAG: hypothetical protein COA65_06345 [Rhodospirillaceae bacterium]
MQTTDSATANAAAKTAAKATAIENKRRRGRAVLRHLMARTHHRHLGPNASDAALRYLEGQRQLVAYLATMIERGGGRIKPDPEPVMDSSQNDKKRKSLWTRIF